MKQIKLWIGIISITALALFFRLYGIDWDQGNHLHPDERFMTMVATGIRWPESIRQYFDASTSTLNPHNNNFPFYVYGTFPLFLTKYIAEIFNVGSYQNLPIIGRQLSAYTDVATAIIVFLLAKEIIRDKKEEKGNIFALLAMLLYTCMVLPIQLSHFFAVDTYLTFFLTLTFLVLTQLFNIKSIQKKKAYLLMAIAGITFGLAIASKISAVLFAPIIGAMFLAIIVKNKKIIQFLILVPIFLIAFYCTMRLAQPYLFATGNILDVTPNPKVLENWNTLKTFNDMSGWYPPAVQWITTKPYIFPLKNIVFWGFGLPIAALSITSIVYISIIAAKKTIHLVQKKEITINNESLFLISVCMIWILLLLGHQGMQFVKAMRYFLPIYPFTAVVTAWTTWIVVEKVENAKIRTIILVCIVACILIYPIAFIRIYAKPHTRVQATEWIYQNIPKGAMIANEYWDDPLPLYLPNKDPSDYEVLMLPLYDADSTEKWEKLSQDLEGVDYIILSSNRLYGSIMTLPEKYPKTNEYYRRLFDGSLGFKKVKEFTSRPTIALPFLSLCLTPPGARYGIITIKDTVCEEDGISFVDDFADESFTVYDHPKVLIFQKEKSE